MKKVPTNQIEIVNKSWMQLVINKEDGYINGSLLAEQVGINLNRFLGLKDTKENTEHIQFLTGNKEKYEVVNSWGNVKGDYIRPLLALDFVAMKKQEDGDYIEYYEFLKKAIAEDDKYEWIEMFHNLEESK